MPRVLQASVGPLMTTKRRHAGNQWNTSEKATGLLANALIFSEDGHEKNVVDDTIVELALRAIPG